VQLWVHSLKVTKLDGLPQELLVEGQGEASINVVPVENSQTHNPPNKVEVRQVVLKKTAEGVTGKLMRPCSRVNLLKHR